MRVCVVNGPNLNMLGIRQPEIYGSATLPEVEAALVAWGADHGIEVTTFQSNHEGELIDRIQACRGAVDGIVINPGAYGHTSYALLDALLSADVPAVEVHLSNVHAREPFRAISVLAPAVARKIFGRGVAGYRHALRLLQNLAAIPPRTIAYGSDPEQVIDLRRAAPGPTPSPEDDLRGLAARSPSPSGSAGHPSPSGGGERLAVLLHGGFWRHEWGRDAIDSLAVDLARRGWTTANVEYRRLGCGGGWPVTADDIAAALDMAVAESGVDEVTLVGHSAGGQLALVAARDRRVTSVLALAAVADLARALELGTGAPSLAQFLGDADPAGPASPVSEPPEVRHLLVHGTADVEVAPELTERYAEVATSRGVPVTVLRPHCGHFALVDPSTPAWADAVAGL